MPKMIAGEKICVCQKCPKNICEGQKKGSRIRIRANDEKGEEDTDRTRAEIEFKVERNFENF